MSVPVVPSVHHVPDHLEERDLVERARRDPEAFGELFERHRGIVFRFAYSRLRNSHDAEDLTSEVCLRALQAIGRYRDTGAPFRGWLLGIAANAIADQYRRRRRHEDLDAHQDDLVAEGCLEDLVVSRDRVRRIGLAAGRLPARQRAVLALRFGHDLALVEVARRMGGSEGAVKLLQHRAIAGVRARMGAEVGALELAS